MPRFTIRSIVSSLSADIPTDAAGRAGRPSEGAKTMARAERVASKVRSSVLDDYNYAISRQELSRQLAGRRRLSRAVLAC